MNKTLDIKGSNVIQVIKWLERKYYTITIIYYIYEYETNIKCYVKDVRKIQTLSSSSSIYLKHSSSINKAPQWYNGRYYGFRLRNQEELREQGTFQKGLKGE